MSSFVDVKGEPDAHPRTALSEMPCFFCPGQNNGNVGVLFPVGIKRQGSIEPVLSGLFPKSAAILTTLYIFENHEKTNKVAPCVSRTQ